MFRFTLTYNGVDTEVAEPKGWTEFKSEIKRDFKSHGVIFKYTSGTIKLGFADGRDILENAFQLEGFDAVVMLTVEKRNTTTDVWETVYTGNAVMENRELTELYFEVDFETSTFQQKVINRMDTKVRIDSTEDLDGNVLNGPINSNTNDWNDIRLINKYIADFREGGESAQLQTFDTIGSSFTGIPIRDHLIINFTGLLTEEFKSVQSPTQVFYSGQLTSGSSKYNFIVNSNNEGDLTLNGTFKYRFYGTLTTTSTTTSIPVNLRLYFRAETSSGILISQVEVFKKTIFINGTASPVNYNSGVLTATLTEATITFIDPGDRIFLYAEVECDMNDGGLIETTNEAYVDIYHSSQVTYSLLRQSGVNSVKHYFVYEVIERILYIITGENNRLSSTFLNLVDLGAASDGCGGYVSITNGFHLRGIDNAPEISLSDILNSLHAIYGIGYSFENVYGEYYLRIELLEYFYGNGEILDLGSPLDIQEGGKYTESTFEELIFNKVEIGYNKYTDDENYTGDIDDFLTKAQYMLPLETVKGQYTQISPLITSGRLIQATYESKDDLTKAWKHDNDNFIVAIVKSGSNYIPENDENFQTLGGFDNSDSATSYNIRFAPVYMFLNHALIVNSVLMGKPLNKKIVNTSVEINKRFSALYTAAATCKLGDSQRLTRTSTGDIEIGNNYEGNRLFKPIQHTFTVAMTTSQLNEIIDAMENNNANDSKNYGYLTYRDSAGNYQTGYPMTIKWNPNDEIAEITTLEKADNYGV